MFFDPQQDIDPGIDMRQDDGQILLLRRHGDSRDCLPRI